MLEQVGEAAEIVGVEITAFEAPDDPAQADRLTSMLAGAIRPLLVGVAT
jgi:hypothetical protein